MMKAIHNGKWKFCNGSLIVARAQKHGTLYVIHAKLCKGEANVATDSSVRFTHYAKYVEPNNKTIAEWGNHTHPYMFE